MLADCETAGRSHVGATRPIDLIMNQLDYQPAFPPGSFQYNQPVASAPYTGQPQHNVQQTFGGGPQHFHQEQHNGMFNTSTGQASGKQVPARSTSLELHVRCVPLGCEASCDSVDHIPVVFVKRSRLCD